MATTHEFHAHLAWQGGGQGVAWGNHRLEWEGRPPVEVSAAPQYKGDPARANPEELFLGAVASCQLLTYLALAPRAGVTVVAYEDRASATLALVDRKMRIAAVTLRPRITVAPGTDVAKARQLVDAAHDGCFIANSVNCPVTAEPEVVVAGA